MEPFKRLFLEAQQTSPTQFYSANNLKCMFESVAPIVRLDNTSHPLLLVLDLLVASLVMWRFLM